MANLIELGQAPVGDLIIKHDTWMHLPDIVERIDGRPERFLIFCDDLSFEADDARYKALKAVLDGGSWFPPMAAERSEADAELADQVGACAEALALIHALIRTHVLAAKRLHAHDTTVTLLAKGGATTARLWTYLRDDSP